jgi:hypothetical protein
LPKNIVIWGKTGTTKSSLALSSKRNKWMGEWDIGSYERAKKDAGTIDLHQYHTPDTFLEEFGFVDTSSMGKEGKGPSSIAYEYHGWTEVYFHGFLKDYLTFLREAPKDEYAVIDTTKPVWDAAQNSIRQRLQQDPRFKNMTTDNLKTAEYSTPNHEQYEIIQKAKTYGHDLVWVGHAKDTWDNNASPPGYTGKYVLDGWKHLESQADIVIETAIRSRRPIAIIRKGNLDMLNWELEVPSLDFITELFDAAKVIVDAEMPIPEGDSDQERAEAVIKLAGML